MSNLELQERVNRFLSELGVPVSAFARNVDLATVTLYKWRGNNLKLSAKVLERIDNYLSRYGF